MRVALFSDVHGNLSALEAVLNSIKQQSADLTIFAGDLCLVGPRPAQCLQLLRQERIPAVYGNTEDWVLGRQAPPERLQALAQWTLEQLAPPERKWLDSLPFSAAINPTADPATALTVVHANPKDVNQIIFPPEAEQQQRYDTIRQADHALTEMLAGWQGQVLAFGHLHLPSIRPWRNRLLLNVSSVSIPGDDDPHAKYALASWDGASWTAEHIRVAYDAALELEAYRTAQPPGWQDSVAMLATQGYIPQRV